MSRLAALPERHPRLRRLLFSAGPWVPPAAWMAAIYWFSAQPELPHAPDALLDFLLKKGLHAAAYAVFDEIHQTRVPGRTGRLMDVAIDVAGATTALILWIRASRAHGG